MTWGTIQVGRLTLRETFGADDKVNANSGVRDIVLKGQESTPPLDLADLRQRSEDIGGLMGALVPVTLTDKPQYDGYYTIKDVGTSVTSYPGSGIERADWNLTLSRVGPDNAVDLESRLAGVNRIKDPSITTVPVAWHAPPIGAYAYHVGATVPTVLTRQSADGPLIVYRNLPANANPRWGCPVSGYGGGRARVLVAGRERTGTKLTIDPGGWEINNGLVRVCPGSAAVSLLVAGYTGGVWRDKQWGVFVTSGVLASPWDAATILRNDYEAVTLRLVRNLAPGRALLDLTLRRGSRFVEGYLQRDTVADQLKVRLNTAEAYADNSTAGYVAASANDADGNRFVAGSARTFTPHSSGGVTKMNATTLDFFVGAAVGGGAAQAGDTPPDLTAQYLAAPSERTMAVAR